MSSWSYPTDERSARMPYEVADEIQGETQFGAEIDNFLRSGGCVKRFASVDVVGDIHDLTGLDDFAYKNGFGPTTGFYFGSALEQGCNKK